MKRNLFLLFVVTTLLFSCSKDENKNEENGSPIVGTWRATAFQAADPNSSTLNFGAEILAKLTAEECYVLTFIFNADLSVVVENAINYVVPNATPTGISVDCPTQKDTESSTYTYDGSVLTIVDQDGMTQSIKVTIDGDTMTVDATDLDVNNLDAAGNVIFKKA